MTVTQRATDGLRTVLVWTASIVLIALGGAGLATAADRPANDVSRPELTVHADRLGGPWIAALAERARAVAEPVDALSQAARDLLAGLGTIDADSMADALAAGDQASASVVTATGALGEIRDTPPAGLAILRLGDTNRLRVAAVDDIVAAGESVTALWQSLAADIRRLARVVTLLGDHDEQVAAAEAAADEARWGAALDALGEAQGAVDDGRVTANELSASDVSGLTALLDRYAAFDAALAGLYGALRDGADPESGSVRQLRDAVERTRAELPADLRSLQASVAAAAGRAIADAVAGVETARGSVTQGLTVLP